MFDWIKSLIHRKSDAQGLVDARALGEEWGDRVVVGIDAYVAERGRQINETYLPVFEERLRILFLIRDDTDDTATEQVAQSEWLGYMRKLSDVGDMLRQEVPRNMSEIYRVADAADARSIVDQRVAEQVEAAVQKAAIEAALVLTQKLDATRASRGLPPLNLPSEGDVGDLAGLQTVYALARQVANGIEQTFREHLERRLVPMQEAILDVFRGQLRTLSTSPPLSPAAVAEIEWGAFRENVQKIPAEIREELHGKLTEWWALADLGGLRPRLDGLIDHRTQQLVDDLEADGRSLLKAATEHYSN